MPVDLDFYWRGTPLETLRKYQRKEGGERG